MFGLDDFAIYLLVTAGSQAVMSLTAPEEKEVPKSAQDKHYDSLVKKWKRIKEKAALRTEIAKFINPDFKPSDESSRARIDEEEAIFAEYDFSFMGDVSGAGKMNNGTLGGALRSDEDISIGVPADAPGARIGYNLNMNNESVKNISRLGKEGELGEVDPELNKKRESLEAQGETKLSREKSEGSKGVAKSPAKEFSINDIKDIKGLFDREEKT